MGALAAPATASAGLFRTGIVGTPVFNDMFAIPSVKLGVVEVKETSEKPSALLVVVVVIAAAAAGIIGVSFFSVGN